MPNSSDVATLNRADSIPWVSRRNARMEFKCESWIQGAQIASILKEHDAGASFVELGRRHAVLRESIPLA